MYRNVARLNDIPRDRRVEEEGRQSISKALAWLEQMGRGRGDVAIRADWCQPRGKAGRNAVAVASRPLLVPRYRVPLTRHPEEARMLERQRRAFADGGLPPMPAGSPQVMAMVGFDVEFVIGCPPWPAETINPITRKPRPQSRPEPLQPSQSRVRV